MSAQAYYGLRRGGSGCRCITSEADVQKLMSGANGVTTVRLVDGDGNLIGERVPHDGYSDDRRIKWLWSYDRQMLLDAIAKAEA